MNIATAIPEAVRTDDFRMLINGDLKGSNRLFEVYNPATNAVIAHAPEATRDDLDEAVAAAGIAFKSWSKLSWDERGAYIHRFTDVIEQRREELATMLTLEQGKPRHSFATREVDLAIHWLRGMADQRLHHEILEDNDEHVVEVQHTPLGVVGAITPWNFPVLLSLWKIAPCLVTGNTMVLKPSPYTPMCTLWFGTIAKDIFPKGVLNIVSGGNDLGQWMTEHPGISKISFTGSSATGKKVMASSAVNLKRITLELGGNDAAIVMPDADLDEVVPQLFGAAFGNSGQWCIAPKRIFIHSSNYRTFADKFVAFAKEKKVGDGMLPDTDLGPIQNKMQYAKLLNMFEDIREKGYNVLLGGCIDESLAGNFVPVTIVDNPPDDSRIVREEPFGPVVPLLQYDDFDEVVERANNTDYGLGGSVWGRDRAKAIEIARQLDTGTVWVNEIQVHGITLPLAGHKQSGMGVENGVEGLCDFTNTKTLMFRK
ncbi:aldehyde dehydrogenase family protein [Mesorhizobium sp. M7A.F.Ca.US.006.01.1.1]|uniref:aldehyde dehydrogenase family protein n=1 Tax=Mesorhizobium sp. M7A.F.Ca.US.006.01.1.1 TaxID=2496707 RepID=UPI000FCC7D86|nr:aldehyde dehydrogenase family protein [Mesorhizobium sp. M7A.F.Ca.US.006.01.1.1]RUZ73779.1 aldehyde dehydrogenase family protein [Mesorhizobium sp. M7A.F.Ca.US.006.01.1.1]